jgi:tRNA(Arg) A34 adenosine deaminase TadA
VAYGPRDAYTSVMRLALEEARAADAHEDVPIGAVVVHEGSVVGRGRNRREADRDPTAHAAGSLWDVGRDPRLNHRPEVVGGVLADECAALLRTFFGPHRGLPPEPIRE